MGFKKAKEYIDKYLPYDLHDNSNNCKYAAFKFMQDHMPKDFISEEDFNL